MKISCKLFIGLFIFIFIIMGCAKSYVRPTPSKEEKPQYGTIGIVHANFFPELKFNHYAVGAFSGALKGAGEGALAPMSALCQGGGHEVGALFCALGIALAPVGALVGSIYGTTKAVPKEEAGNIQDVMKKAVADLKTQEKLVNHIMQNCSQLTDYKFILLSNEGPKTIDKTPDYTSLKTKGIQTILEVSVINIGFLGGEGKDPSIAFFMDVHARLIRTEDGKEILSILKRPEYIHKDIHSYVSSQRKINEWAKDSSRLLSDELENCYKTLAEQISDTAFLALASQAKLDALDPKVKQGSAICWEALICEKRILPQVESLRPKMVWEPFPANSVSDITYDLKIWKAENDFPAKLVYFRRALTESSHALENSLEPATKYYWAVRARFKYDGHTGATLWPYPTKPSPFKLKKDWPFMYYLDDFVTLK